MGMVMKAMQIVLVAAVIFAAAGFATPARADSALSLRQVVELAVEANPQVRASRFRWEAAQHQIIQNYTPADPQFSFTNSDSWRGFLSGSGLHNMTVSQSLQFPGKGLLQGRNAQRSAEIARLMYVATVRDVRAQAQITYYQIQLDMALSDLISENIVSLQQLLKVTQVAYTVNTVTQGDFINAEFAILATQECIGQTRLTLANDKTILNILLDRRADEPLEVDPKFDLTTFETSLDQIVARAISSRQEIVQAALTEQNQDTAVTRAQLEYGPDYTVAAAFDHWFSHSFAPTT